MNRLFWVLSVLGLSACSSLLRDPRSGYYEYSESSLTAQDVYQEKRRNAELDVREELGLGNRPLSDDEQQALEDRMRLKRRESRLATKREKRQYYNVRSALKSDRERAYFLSLPTVEARERWAQNRGVFTTDEKRPEDVAKAIESQDIALGMTQKSVMESWGDPDAVEAAGDAVYGYERWKYNRYISGNEGYQKELRVVYFEGGRVVGWERP